MSHSFVLPHGRDNLLDRWGHYSAQLLSVAVAIVIVLGTGYFAPSAGLLMFTVLLVSFVITTWLLMRQHDRKLCEMCAASMPLNAAQQGARYRLRFVIAHSASNRRILVPYLVVLIGSNFLQSWRVLPTDVSITVWALIQSSMVYLILAHAAHRKFQPWCQRCNADGGGTEFNHDDTPDLPRGDRRQLV